MSKHLKLVMHLVIVIAAIAVNYEPSNKFMWSMSVVLLLQYSFGLGLKVGEKVANKRAKALIPVIANEIDQLKQAQARYEAYKNGEKTIKKTT